MCNPPFFESEADAKGKMRKKADPTKELQKKMRAMAEEREKMGPLDQNVST